MGLSIEQANQILTDNGYFQGLNRLFNQFMSMPGEKGAAAKVRVFSLLLEKVVDARTRIAKLQVSVNRLEAACREGTVPKLAEGLRFDTTDTYAFLNELNAFDGFAASVLESDASLLAAVLGPESASVQIKSPKTSLALLLAGQRNDSFRLMTRHPELFEMVDFPGAADDQSAPPA